MKDKNYKKYFVLAVALMILASMSILVGAIFKIQHWPMGGEIILMGMIGEVVAIILTGVGLYKFNQYRKSQIQ